MVYDHEWNERKKDIYIYVGKRACDGDRCVREERERKIELSNMTSLRKEAQGVATERHGGD